MGFGYLFPVAAEVNIGKTFVFVHIDISGRASVSKVANNILIFISDLAPPRYGSKNGYKILSWERQELCIRKFYLFFRFWK
jgi:hypothetical protein